MLALSVTGLAIAFIFFGGFFMLVLLQPNAMIMLAVFANLPGHDICDRAVSQIEDSSILTFIQDNNIIMDIIDKTSIIP